MNKTIDPEKCYLFLYDVYEQASNGDFTSVVRVKIESVSHCGNWVHISFEDTIFGSGLNFPFFRNRPIYVNTRLLMTKEEANLTKKSTVPKVGDLVISVVGKPWKDKKYLVSKVNKATIHRLDTEIGQSLTIGFSEIMIIARDGKSYDEN